MGEGSSLQAAAAVEPESESGRPPWKFEWRNSASVSAPPTQRRHNRFSEVWEKPKTNQERHERMAKARKETEAQREAEKGKRKAKALASQGAEQMQQSQSRM